MVHQETESCCGQYFGKGGQTRKSQTAEGKALHPALFSVLFALYCLIPRYEESANMPYESSLIVCHLWTAVVMLIYGCKKKVSLKMAVTLAVLFAPAIFAYFYSDLWYHIVICAAVALAAMWIGTKMRKKKD